MGKRKKSIERIVPEEDIIMDLINESTNAKIVKGNQSKRYMTRTTNMSNFLSDLQKLPLPWQQVFYENRMHMMLNIDYYTVTIPTSFYVTNINNSDANNIPPIIDWKITMPHIDLLYSFIKSAAHIYKMHKSECAGVLVYNKTEDSWVLVYPQQTIHGGSVTFNPSELSLSNDDVFLIDLHSHHTMSIGFSSTDDHSDCMLGAISHISVLIKNINSLNMINLDQNVELRITVQGKHYNLSLDDVFDMDEDSYIIDDVILEESAVMSSSSILPETEGFQTWYHAWDEQNRRNNQYSKYNADLL